MKTGTVTADGSEHGYAGKVSPGISPAFSAQVYQRLHGGSSTALTVATNDKESTCASLFNIFA